jgi:hypothetical protein
MNSLRFIKTNGTTVYIPCEEINIEPGVTVFGISKRDRKKAGKVTMIVSPYGNVAFKYGEYEKTVWYV